MPLFLIACGGSGDKLPLLPPDSSLYYNSPPAFTVTIPISPVVPTHNVSLTNFSIIPNLPAGLVLDAGTGVISGTPTQVSATTTYTVSVPDGTSAVTATLVITVNPLPANISHPRAAYTGVSLNPSGAISDRYRLTAAGDLIVLLNRTCSPMDLCMVEGALAGPTLVIRQQTGWNTYSTVDGALIAHLDIAPGFATAWSLATDGSYLLFAGTEGVQAITPQGMPLFTSTGETIWSLAPIQFSGLGVLAEDYVWFVSESTPRVDP